MACSLTGMTIPVVHRIYRIIYAQPLSIECILYRLACYEHSHVSLALRFDIDGYISYNLAVQNRDSAGIKRNPEDFLTVRGIMNTSKKLINLLVTDSKSPTIWLYRFALLLVGVLVEK